MTTPSASNGLYSTLIGQPVRRWYLRPISVECDTLTPEQQQSLRRQAVIGWLQTVLLSVVLIQVIFAGLLRALPPDVRTSLGFLHRIEWRAYLGMALIAAQVAVGWTDRIVLTSRFYLLAWRFGRPRIVVGKAACNLQLAYLLVLLIMVGAVLWVRANGFIVQPTR